MSIYRDRNGGKKLFKKGGDSPVEIPRKRAENIRMAPNGQNFD